MPDLMHTLLSSATSPPGWPAPDARHALWAGASGTGKTQSLIYAARQSLLARPQRGLHVIDPESDICFGLLEFIARHTPHRRVHMLDPRSTSRAFGLPLLHVADRDPQGCHDAAIRAVAVLGQVANFNQGEFGPRITKGLQLGCFALARRGLPLVALSELFASRAASRETLADAMPYNFMADAFNAINGLPAKQLIEYTDALVTRMLVIFGSPIIRRIFGQAPARNLDIDQILARGDVVLLPLGGLEHRDAVLVGTAYYSILHHAALKRPLDAATPADVFIDEVSDYLTPDLARGFDRLRKRKVFLRVACQRFAQFTKPDDPGKSTLSAILTNARLKIVMGGMMRDDAELLAHTLFGGHLPLDTIYKPGSKRPVLVGHRKITLSSSALARHEAETHTHGESSSESQSRMHAIADATSTGTGSSLSSGHSSSLSMLPDGSLLSPPTHLSHGDAHNRSRGSSHSHTHSTSHVAAQQSARALARSSSHGRAAGRSEATGTHETMLAELAMLESESYSLAEKEAAAVGLIQSMPPRAALIKIDSGPPVYIARTPDLLPAFRSAAFRDQAMALFMQKLDRDDPALTPIEADAEIATALAELTDPVIAEPDFAAGEPIPLRRKRG